ncbi:hydrolase [Corynebacterium phocae]|uniref:Hydrolase n=1 Tax=Corynebacterium phocae TaxID=161895 RepID=A0A1L7D0Z2_9CORY|nr:alpha/beta hydrolase [Corynebacterium phocae]APT91758.1 hydrolase [Corynebacterium phocae]KAA8728522.1 alpha/beta hydrolase [Corynebacterium phocae]
MVSPSVVELPGPWAHEFLHTRGVRLHAAVTGPATGPLILCIHGSVGGWFDYRGVLEPLAAAGFRVAALDLRGYGMSDKPPIEPGQDVRTLIGDIAGAIQALGYEQAVLVGNDTGAALAWAVAAERPARVAAVVSISGAHPEDLRRSIMARPWDFVWFILRAAASRLPMPLFKYVPREFLVRKDLSLNTAGPMPELSQLREVAINIGNTLRGSVWNHRLLTALMPRASAGKKVAAPVLFIHANQGLWAPVFRRASRRARVISALHIAGTKNLPHAEAPEEFARAVIAWLTPPDTGADQGTGH